jgi:putative spermidine/putrescine transport system permease protein
MVEQDDRGLMQAPADIALPVVAGHQPRRRRTHRSLAPLLAGPGVLFVVVFLLLPLGLMLRYSLNRFVPGELMEVALTAGNYVRFLHDPFYQSVLWTTLWISAVSTATCAIAGFPVAFYLARTAGPRLKPVLMMAVVLPLLMGNSVRTAAWMVLLGSHGVIAGIVGWIVPGVRIELMYTPAAVVIGLVSVLLPFMIITVKSTLENADRSVEEAAASLGAPPYRVLFRIVLPLCLPGLLAGIVLCFVLAMNAYATPVLLGGPQMHMMAPTVYEQIAKAMNWPFGAALAFILMAVTLVLTVASNVLVQRRFRKWTG